MGYIWQKKRLSEFGIIFNGNSINEKVKKDKYLGLADGLPFIATKDIDYSHRVDYENGIKIPLNEGKFKVAHKNSVLICAEGGNAGKKMAFNERDICFGNKLFAIEVSDKIEPKFVYYWYLTPLFSKQFRAQMNGLIGGISIGKFKELEMATPPLEEQERIVKILDEAIENIEKAKENTEKNLQNAKELFESYLQKTFNNPEINWETFKLVELGDITSSKRIFKSDYVKEGVPFYRTKEIKELVHSKPISLELFISNAKYDEIKNSFGVPNEGDVLISAVGTIGEIYVVKKDDIFYFKDGNILWLKDFLNVHSSYLKYALTSFVEQIKKLSIGSAYNALTIEKLKQYSIPLPKISEQKAIATKLDELLEQTNKLEENYKKKLADLDELKKSILQKAFNGEL